MRELCALLHASGLCTRHEVNRTNQPAIVCNDQGDANASCLLLSDEQSSRDAGVFAIV